MSKGGRETLMVDWLFKCSLRRSCRQSENWGTLATSGIAKLVYDNPSIDEYDFEAHVQAIASNLYSIADITNAPPGQSNHP